MVTNERIKELFAKASIPRGMWVAVSQDGQIVTTGNSRSEVLDVLATQPCGRGVADPVIIQNGEMKREETQNDNN